MRFQTETAPSRGGKGGWERVSDFVISLDRLQPQDVKRVGGKAAALSRLIHGGFPVPAGICVTTDSFRLALDDKRQHIERILAEHELSAASQKIAEILADLKIPASIHSALIEMIDEHQFLAVR